MSLIAAAQHVITREHSDRGIYSGRASLSQIAKEFCHARTMRKRISGCDAATRDLRSKPWRDKPGELRLELFSRHRILWIAARVVGCAPKRLSIHELEGDTRRPRGRIFRCKVVRDPDGRPRQQRRNGQITHAILAESIRRELGEANVSFSERCRDAVRDTELSTVRR